MKVLDLITFTLTIVPLSKILTTFSDAPKNYLWPDTETGTSQQTDPFTSVEPRYGFSKTGTQPTVPRQRPQKKPEEKFFSGEPEY